MNISKLDRLVKESKLNKSEIADAAGITRVTLDNAINGADVKISTVEAVARVLGVSPATFFDESDNIQTSSDVEVYKQEISRLQSLLNKQKQTKVVVEIDIDSDEFIKLGLKDKVIQVLNKQKEK